VGASAALVCCGGLLIAVLAARRKRRRDAAEAAEASSGKPGAPGGPIKVWMTTPSTGGRAGDDTDTEGSADGATMRMELARGNSGVGGSFYGSRRTPRRGGSSSVEISIVDPFANDPFDSRIVARM
jgi:hypothetical protein